VSGRDDGAMRFYLDDRAGILGYFVTARKAAEVFAEHECDGDLVGGFSYWASGPGIARLVLIRVTPVSVDQVPAAVHAELEGSADSVLIPEWGAVDFAAPPVGGFGERRIGGQR
jgi:hypothetical protein